MIVRIDCLASLFAVTVAMIHDEYFHFTFVAPNALRRLIHVNTVTLIVFVMDGRMVIVMLRTADMQAIFR